MILDMMDVRSIPGTEAGISKKEAGKPSSKEFKIQYCVLGIKLSSQYRKIPVKIFRGSFRFFQYFIQHCLVCRLSDSSLSEDVGIEPRMYITECKSDF